MVVRHNPKIILATTNRGKIAELTPLLQEYGLQVRTLADFPQSPPVEETGSTFLENARLKARAVAQYTGMISLADDSGLVVPSLNGAPGIFSSRFGDELQMLPEETKDQRNIRKLLMLLEKKPSLNRKAFFQTVIVALAPDGKELVAEGKWKGEILQKPRGNNGFGYDSVFLDKESGKTAAELTLAEKMGRSHRGKALKSFIKQLPEFLKIAL